MTNIGLVIFEDIKSKGKDGYGKIKNLALKLSGKITGFLFNAGFFKSRTGTGLYFFSRRDALKNGLSCHELPENVKIWIIRFPFHSGILPNLDINYVAGYLERLCTEQGISDCLIPGPVRNRFPEGKFNCPHSGGKLLLESLLVPVLEEIYHRMSKRIGQLDIVIIAGNDAEEVFTIVRMLEPHISFITIAAADRASLEGRLSELAADSGLSFSISSEFKNQLKHADLIINLAKPQDISQYRMHKKSLLLNLHDSVESSIPGENTVVNNIVFTMAGTDIRDILYELHGFYSRNELYELLITKQLSLDTCDKFTFQLAERIEHEFKKAGCRITGFVGRRGSISVEDAVRTIRCN